MTGWLILINVAVHAVRQLLPSGLDDRLVNGFGYWTASPFHSSLVRVAVTLVTYQFLHGGWDHLGMNMVTLLAFGAGVERALGRFRFIVLYLVTGVAGALVESVIRGPTAGDVLIGASGSISGVFGALLVIWGFHRRGRRPLGIVPMAILWSLVLAGTGILGIGANGSTVAWVAHIGGFITGIVFGLLFERNANARREGLRQP